MRSTNKVYIQGIDHLRGLAALLVVLFHCIHLSGEITQAYVPANPLLSFFEEGHTGVALFITITGFIFTTIIGDNQIVYSRFLRNRFLRIFPLLFIISFFTDLEASGVAGGDPLAMLKFFNLFGGGIYRGTWTLVVEFQFYLFFPIFYVYFRDNCKGTLKKYLPFAGMILVGLMFRLMFFMEKGNAQDVGYWTIFGRIDQFMLGAMASLFVQDIKAARIFQNKFAGLAALILGLVLATAMFHYFNIRQLYLRDPSSPDPLWLIESTAEGVMYAWLLVAWIWVLGSAEGRLVNIAAYIGSISYSTYLIHFFVLDMVVKIMSTYGITFSSDLFTNACAMAFLLVYPLTLVFSTVTFELIEKPFFKYRVSYLKANPAPVV